MEGAGEGSVSTCYTSFLLSLEGLQQEAVRGDDKFG